MNTKRAAIILAAGKGKRMHSELAKVLHEINGRPMIAYLLDTLSTMDFEKRIVVIGHQGERVQAVLANYKVEFIWQREQLGTGHAVMMAEAALTRFIGTTLVALGDVPFLTAQTIERLFNVHEKTKAAATCLSSEFADPTGYGRIVRKDKTDILMKIVEHEEASMAELRITEINTGTFCFNNNELAKYLKMIKPDNSQKEYYLTDVIKPMYDSGLRVSVIKSENPEEVCGINSLGQLKEMQMKFAVNPNKNV